MGVALKLQFPWMHVHADSLEFFLEDRNKFKVTFV